VLQPIIPWHPVFVIEPCLDLGFKDRTVVFRGPRFCGIEILVVGSKVNCGVWGVGILGGLRPVLVL
jgi:hypothetical protein